MNFLRVDIKYFVYSTTVCTYSVHLSTFNLLKYGVSYTYKPGAVCTDELVVNISA